MIENAAAMVQSIAAAYINRSQFVGYTVLCAIIFLKIFVQIRSADLLYI